MLAAAHRASGTRRALGTPLGTPIVPRQGSVVRPSLRVGSALVLLLALAAPAWAEDVPFLIRFTGNVHGLAAGAPVDIQGIRIGTVRSVGLDVAPDGDRFTVPVTVDLNPALFPTPAASRRPTTPEETYAAADALV